MFDRLCGKSDEVGTGDAIAERLDSLMHTARFTWRARKVMELADQQAKRLGQELVDTEHILLGLLKEGSGLAVNVLRNLEVDVYSIRLEVEKVLQPRSSIVTMARCPLTPRAERAIEFATDESRNLNHNYLGTEHLLLGLLRAQEGVAAQVLMNLGLDVDEARAEVQDLLG